MTPMMLQYFEVKNQYPDAIVFYRLGDFYEMFFEDAKVASKELELTLTGRDCGEGERAPMCGVPFHSADNYIAKLVSRGYKVVICEQTEDPAQAKGLVRREVVRIVTPGTVIDGNMLSEGKNNYICAVYASAERFGICFADVSTGEIAATDIPGGRRADDRGVARLISELAIYCPAEVIFSEDVSKYEALGDYLSAGRIVCRRAEELFDLLAAEKAVAEQFGASLEELTLSADAAVAVGALLAFVKDTQRTDLANIRKLSVYAGGQFVELDSNTRRNLELCETLRTKEKKGTLLWVLDHTRTSMGARCLRKWVELPLRSESLILRRQDAVEELYGDFMLREELMLQLKGMLDLERIITKIVYGTANARDLLACAATLEPIPAIRELMKEVKSRELTDIRRELDEMTDIRELIARAIIDEPPLSVREGGMIRPGYSAEVDRLTAIKNGGRDFIRQIEQRERERTGIKNLKVGYNRVFGYYIEISNSNLADAPADYMRKQTLTNGERFITEELKKIEGEILGASDRLQSLEYALFDGVRKAVAEAADRLTCTAAALARLDVFLSLSDVATKNNYVLPQVNMRQEIVIKDGRHPVVEQFVKNGYFVPNDTTLDTEGNRLMIITGPNMAGKSTYMRQVALITLMAQMGSFVPAKEAEIGLVDKVFTRVGASDDLASGQSTFMLEMTEVAYILQNATRQSLIIYDEIGRGTSTYDGMSIARAVAEYTAGKKIGAKTLFATHYHELTELEGQIPGAVNYNIAAKKKGDDITFLRRIVRGAADDSYGIEVAKLAGVSGEVIKRAKAILSDLIAKGEIVARQERAEAAEQRQDMGFNLSFDDMRSEEIVARIKSIDVNYITPMDALQIIGELKKMAD